MVYIINELVPVVYVNLKFIVDRSVLQNQYFFVVAFLHRTLRVQYLSRFLKSFEDTDVWKSSVNSFL